MAVLYFYLNWRESSGFLWICVYVLVLIPFEDYKPFNFIYAIFGTGAAIGITYEVLNYFGKDPFSEVSFHNLFQKALKLIGRVLKIVGVKPKVSIIDFQETEDAKKTIEYLRNSKWLELEAYLKHMESNDRNRVIESVIEVDGRPKALDKWLGERPHSAMAHIVSGLHYIHWAWEARGGGLGSTVSDKGIGLFFERLFMAKEQLERAIELENKYADPYVGLMTIAMGTGIEREAIWSYFAKALVHCENHYSAHSSMINAVAEKWGGEEGEMFVVAHQAASKAKEGSHLAGIIAEAHIEQWLYLLMCEEDEQAAIYFREQSVRDDLRNAYEKIRKTGLETAEHIQAFNNYAFCFYMADLNSLAKEVIVKLDGNYVEHPWDYLGSPFMANFDTAYAIDHAIEQLGVVTTDLPDIVVQKGLSKAGSDQQGDAAVTHLSEASDHHNRRVFKTPIVVPLSVLMVVVIYFGYPLLEFFGDTTGLLDNIKSRTLELFILCEIGLIGLILTGKKQLIKFLAKYPAIHNRESLEAFKVVARTNMFSALLCFTFLGAGALTGIMTIVNYSFFPSALVGILCIVASVAITIYNGYEQRMKQIECLDEELEDELESVLDCWFNKAFPNF